MQLFLNMIITYNQYAIIILNICNADYLWIFISAIRRIINFHRGSFHKWIYLSFLSVSVIYWYFPNFSSIKIGTWLRKYIFFILGSTHQNTIYIYIYVFFPYPLKSPTTKLACRSPTTYLGSVAVNGVWWKATCRYLAYICSWRSNGGANYTS